MENELLQAPIQWHFDSWVIKRGYVFPGTKERDGEEYSIKYRNKIILIKITNSFCGTATVDSLSIDGSINV